MRTTSNAKINPANPAIADRVFTFLRVFATVPDITTTLAKYAGFKKKDYDEGWKLLCRVAHFADGVGPNTPDIAGALREIDEWEEVAFRRARAALHRLHPEQEAFVFRNLEPTHGPQAVVGVRVFLDRLDALESSQERTATKDADHAALATLAERGFDTDERARIRALVDLAMTAPDLDAVVAGTALPAGPRPPSPYRRSRDARRTNEAAPSIDDHGAASSRQRQPQPCLTEICHGSALQRHRW